MKNIYKRIEKAISASDWSPQGHLALASGGAIDVYLSSDSSIIFQLREEKRRIKQLRLSPEGKSLAVLMTEDDCLSDRLELWSFDLTDSSGSCLCTELQSVAEAEIAYSRDGTTLAAYLVTHWRGKEKVTVVICQDGEKPTTASSKALEEIHVGAINVDESQSSAITVWTYDEVQRWTVKADNIETEVVASAPNRMGWMSRPTPGNDTVAYFAGSSQDFGVWNYKSNLHWSGKRKPEQKEKRDLFQVFTTPTGERWLAIGGPGYLNPPRWLEQHCKDSKVVISEIGKVLYCQFSPSGDLIFLARPEGQLEIINLEGKQISDLTASIRKAAKKRADNSFVVSKRLMTAKRKRCQKVFDSEFDEIEVEKYCKWLAKQSVPLWKLISKACMSTDKEKELEGSSEGKLSEQFAPVAASGSFSATAAGGLLRLAPITSHIPYERHKELPEFFNHPVFEHVEGLDMAFDELCFENEYGNQFACELAKTKHAASLVDLTFSGSGLTCSGAEELLSSPFLQQLRRLCFCWEALGLSSLEILAQHLPKLQSLTLEFCLGGNDVDKALCSLASAPWAEQLRWLDLSGNSLGDDSLEYLLRSPLIRGLQVLRYGESEDSNRIGEKGALSLAKSKETKELLFLDLHGNVLNAPAISALIESPNLKNLRFLGLGGIGLSAEVREEPFDVVQPLVAAKDWGNLRALNLSWNKLTQSSAQLLAECPQTAQLDYLDLSWNKIGEAGVRLLLSSPHIKQIKHLSLHSNGVKDKELRRKTGAVECWWSGLPRDIASQFVFIRHLSRSAFLNPANGDVRQEKED